MLSVSDALKIRVNTRIIEQPCLPSGRDFWDQNNLPPVWATLYTHLFVYIFCSYFIKILLLTLFCCHQKRVTEKTHRLGIFLTACFVFLNEKFPYAGKGFLISLDLISIEMKVMFVKKEKYSRRKSSLGWGPGFYTEFRNQTPRRKLRCDDEPAGLRRKPTLLVNIKVEELRYRNPSHSQWMTRSKWGTNPKRD